MIRKEIINGMVSNYYREVKFLGETDKTLKEYLQGLQKTRGNKITNEEIEYALTLTKPSS